MNMLLQILRRLDKLGGSFSQRNQWSVKFGCRDASRAFESLGGLPYRRIFLDDQCFDLWALLWAV